MVETDQSLGINERFAAGMATVEGDFVVFMKPCDIMAPDALFECVRAINEYSDCDVLYTDVDAFDADGVHFQPVFRPDFSPELLRSYNYLRDLVVVRSSLLSGLPNLPYAIMGAAGYDLALRVTEKARRVCHVPRVLCHRRFCHKLIPPKASKPLKSSKSRSQGTGCPLSAYGNQRRGAERP